MFALYVPCIINGQAQGPAPTKEMLFFSSQQTGPLSDITQEKAESHSHDSRASQATRRHTDKLFEPALHGLW